MGYGKSVFMSQLFKKRLETGEHCYWISLDDRTTRAEQLLWLMEKTLFKRHGGSSHTHPLFTNDPSLKTRMQRLIESVEGTTEQPFSLFIDNLDYCIDEQVGYLLDTLIFETGSNLQVILSSCTEPPINLVLAKLQGHICRLGYKELSLSTPEVADLLGTEIVGKIGNAGVSVIAQQTEGWPVAVRMAQIILSASNNPLAEINSISSTNQDLSTLLNRNVVHSLPQDLQNFILQISSLRKFSNNLCRYVTKNTHTDEYIDILINKNIFTIPLDHHKTWHRFHTCFKKHLTIEAEKDIPKPSRQNFLIRAAEWCNENDQWDDAIEYAIEAEANELASKILEKISVNLVRDRGDLENYDKWVETLKKRNFNIGPETEYWYLWSLILHRRYQQGRQYIRQIKNHERHYLTSESGFSRTNEFNRKIEISEVCLDIFSDNLNDAHKKADIWIRNITPDDNPFDITSAYCTESAYFSSQYLFSEAKEAAQAAQVAAYQSNSAYAQGWIIILNALPFILEGNFKLIQPELNASLALLKLKLGEESAIVGSASLLSALCAIETGQRAEAETELLRGMYGSQVHGIVDVVACGLDAAVKLWSPGETDPGMLPLLRSIVSAYAPRANIFLSCFLTRRMLRLGRIEEALVEASRMNLYPERSISIPKTAMSTARNRDAYLAAAVDLYVSVGDLRSAEKIIEDESKRARSEGRILRQVELALNEMEISIQKGNPIQAKRNFTRAITLAASRGIVRPFDDNSNSIARIVENTKANSWGFALAQEKRFFSEICERLPLKSLPTKETSMNSGIDSPLADPLTKRQIELLKLLDAGLSNQQIADRLHLSLTTIKGHLQKLYAKLNVQNRSSAIARARMVNLL
jgi:LuxR family maltose regulon positive regulatory protein